MRLWAGRPDQDGVGMMAEKPRPHEQLRSDFEARVLTMAGTPFRLRMVITRPMVNEYAGSPATAKVNGFHLDPERAPGPRHAGTSSGIPAGLTPCKLHAPA